MESLTEVALRFDLVVIDSLAAANPGIDENATSARQALDMLHAIAVETNCSFLVIHHSAKSGRRSKGGDLREALRGSSAIFDAPDGVVMTRLGDDRGEHKTVLLDHVKNRFGPTVRSAAAQLVPRGR